GVEGAWRFTQRLWRLVEGGLEALGAASGAAPAEWTGVNGVNGVNGDDASMRLSRATHKTIAGVTEDIERFRFNRAVARIYELANSIDELAAGANPAARRETMEILVRLLAPMMPHLAEELWQR